VERERRAQNGVHWASTERRAKVTDKGGSAPLTGSSAIAISNARRSVRGKSRSSLYGNFEMFFNHLRLVNKHYMSSIMNWPDIFLTAALQKVGKLAPRIYRHAKLGKEKYVRIEVEARRVESVGRTVSTTPHQLWVWGSAVSSTSGIYRNNAWYNILAGGNAWVKWKCVSLTPCRCVRLGTAYLELTMKHSCFLIRRYMLS